MSTNDDFKERWHDVIPWTTFWEEFDTLLSDVFDQGRAANKTMLDRAREIMEHLENIAYMSHVLQVKIKAWLEQVVGHHFGKDSEGASHEQN